MGRTTLSHASRKFANLFHRRDLTIGARLTACFMTIVVLMMAADVFAIWKFRQLAAQTEMLDASDKASSAMVRLHLDVNSFSGRVVVLTRSHDDRHFANEAAHLREIFLRDVRDAEQTLQSSPEIAQDALISSTLKTLKTTLPSQIDSEIDLANAGDWTAVQLRLTGQIQDLLDLSSSLVEQVQDRVLQQRAKVNEQTERMRHSLFIGLPTAWSLTLVIAAMLGWYITRTITSPLSELTSGAQALARGDFLHEVKIAGNDELAVLGQAFNSAGRQLHHQFEMTLEARVAERTRIARDLHDTMLQSFHGLLLRFQTAFQMLPEQPVEAKERLGRAIENAADAIIEGREAVQGLRDSTVQGNDLGPALRTLGEELASRCDREHPRFRVTVEGVPQKLHPILRDEIYKIAAEALRNAFKHAEPRNVYVEIHYHSEQFQVSVYDDGKGIDPAVLAAGGTEGHYGLAGMRERAALIGAQLRIWRADTAGTVVELRLPTGIANSNSGGSRTSGKFVRSAGGPS